MRNQGGKTEEVKPVKCHPRFWRTAGHDRPPLRPPTSHTRHPRSPGSGGPCHPTLVYTSGCVGLRHPPSLLSPALLPPLLATCHAGWQPPVATPGTCH